MEASRFLFASCQVGAEATLKAEIELNWPGLRGAFSRPGFVTFKLSPEVRMAEGVELQSVFARTYGWCQGSLKGDQAQELASQFWQQLTDQQGAHLHVWQRDARTPGEDGFEPSITPLATELGHVILAASQQSPLPLNRRAKSGQKVLDCIVVEPNEWWIGYHQANSIAGRWPGGICPAVLPDYAVSRAYLKMEEALRWSRIPIRPGDRCVEIGSSPGGSCQALLDHGLEVVGIDPAEMDPALLEHAKFTHLQKRPVDMKRREFKDFRWLTADMNVAPQYTLDALEAIVTHDIVRIRGMIVTLKLMQWELAAEIEQYVERIRSWGYQHVRLRQLSFNRQEICLVALKSRAFRRRLPGANRKKKRGRSKSTKPAVDATDS
ncbi:MAG: SAM-dependent methyltransferase [Pirellulaceae bacterium]